MIALAALQRDSNKHEREHMGQSCAARFYPAFKQNMEAIGLTAPQNLFSSQVSALQTIGQLAGLIKTFGMKVTLRELIHAGDLTEALAYAGALYSAYYLGGAIGSLIVARDEYAACIVGPAAAARARQALFAQGVFLSAPMQLFLVQHPELFDLSSPRRGTYGVHARAGTGLK